MIEKLPTKCEDKIGKVDIVTTVTMIVDTAVGVTEGQDLAVQGDVRDRTLRVDIALLDEIVTVQNLILAHVHMNAPAVDATEAEARVQQGEVTVDQLHVLQREMERLLAAVMRRLEVGILVGPGLLNNLLRSGHAGVPRT